MQKITFTVTMDVKSTKPQNILHTQMLAVHLREALARCDGGILIAPYTTRHVVNLKDADLVTVIKLEHDLEEEDAVDEPIGSREGGDLTGTPEGEEADVQRGADGDSEE